MTKMRFVSQLVLCKKGYCELDENDATNLYTATTGCFFMDYVVYVEWLQDRGLI